jgi:hypothetical protein
VWNKVWNSLCRDFVSAKGCDELANAFLVTFGRPGIASLRQITDLAYATDSRDADGKPQCLKSVTNSIQTIVSHRKLARDEIATVDPRVPGKLEHQMASDNLSISL